MSRTTLVLLMAFMVVGLIGVGGFFLQVFRHLQSKALLSTKKNATMRAIWLLLLSALMLAMLKSESINPDSLFCAGLIFTGIGGLVLFFGYFIERQYNRFIKDQKDDNSK